MGFAHAVGLFIRLVIDMNAGDFVVQNGEWWRYTPPSIDCEVPNHVLTNTDTGCVLVATNSARLLIKLKELA